MILWLAVDPGPAKSGWALLATGDGRPPRYVDGGHDPLARVLAQVERADRVAVECQGKGLYDRRRHDALIETARVEGRLLQALEGWGFEPTTLTAGQWRADVVGSSSPDDATIERVLRLRVLGLPTLAAEHSAHVMDAVGLALAASCSPGQQVRLALTRGRR